MTAEERTIYDDAEPTRMRQPIIIGLCGYMGSGKSTVARELAHLLPDAHIVPFAATLKRMCRALGLTEAQVYGSEKDTPCELLGGKAPRHAMQTLGTEWGRGRIDDRIWLRAWKASIPTGARFVLVDDVRFANEAGALHTLIQVDRRQERNASTGPKHASESLGDLEHTIDAKIENNGTEQELRAKVREYLCGATFELAQEVLDALLPTATGAVTGWVEAGDRWEHPRGGPFSVGTVENGIGTLELDELDAAYRAVPRVLPPGWSRLSGLGAWAAERRDARASRGVSEQDLIRRAWDLEIERCKE